METYKGIQGLTDLRIYSESYIKDGKRRIKILDASNDKVIGDYVSQNLIDLMVKMNKKWHKRGYNPVWVVNKMR